MANATATFLTYQAIGIREDLEDVIYNVSPTDTPFLSNAAKMKATQIKHEWQTDSLAAAVASNAQLEGDDSFAATTVAPTTRLANYCQISRKVMLVSGTQDVVLKAGRDRELAYQLAKQGKELKRDIESSLTQNNGSTAGTSASLRYSASLESWLSTNRVSSGAAAGGGTTPGFNSSTGLCTAPTDGTATTTLSQANFKSAIQNAWTQGGSPKMVMCGPYNKQKISGFSGIATLFKDVPSNNMGMIIGAADVYVSDFGQHMIVPNRFQRDQTVFVLDMDYWGVAYLRPFQSQELAKTGDATKYMLLAEYTLVSKNEKASAKIVDVATS